MSWDSVGSTLISAGQNLVGKLIDYNLSSKMQNNSFTQQKELMQQQQEYNKYNLSNATLLEGNQLRQLGINPAAQGSTPSGSSGSLPNATPPSYPNITGGLGSTDLLQAELLQSQVKKNDAEADKLIGDNARSEKLVDAQINEINTSITLSQDELNNMRPLQRKQYEQNIKTLNAQEEQYKASVQALLSQKRLTDEQKQFVLTEIKKLQQELIYYGREAESRIANNYASANNNNAQASAVPSLIALNQSNKQLVDKEARTEGWRSIAMKHESYDAYYKRKLNEFNWSLQDKLGVGYYATKTVISDVVDGGAKVATTARDVGITVAAAKYKSPGKSTLITDGINAKLGPDGVLRGTNPKTGLIEW